MEKDGAIQLDEYDHGGQEAFSDEVSPHDPEESMTGADTKSSHIKEEAIMRFEKRLDVSASKMTI